MARLRHDADEAVGGAAWQALGAALTGDGSTRADAVCHLINTLHDAGRADVAAQVVAEVVEMAARHGEHDQPSAACDAVTLVAQHAEACHASRMCGPRPVDVVDGAA